MIEHLNNHLVYQGNLRCGEEYPSTNEIVNKINEIVDYLNKEEKCLH